MNNLNNLFLDYCKTNSFEVNQAQLEVIDQLSQFKNNYINASLIKSQWPSRGSGAPIR